jgi:hypothetical protein
MSDKTKLAPGSNLTVADQKRIYAETMGPEALARQKKLADLEAKRCTCHPSSVKWRWEGMDKPTTRRVHEKDCPKWKDWMAGKNERSWAP